jgi:hypothetical protein
MLRISAESSSQRIRESAAAKCQSKWHGVKLGEQEEYAHSDLQAALSLQTQIDICKRSFRGIMSHIITSYDI